MSEKVDSTKGSSMINPLNYKGDVLVQVWMDSRVVATLAQWLENSGTYPRFMSQAIRRPSEVLVSHLIDEGEVEMVDDTITARSMLQRRFNVDLNRGGRGGKNILHNQVLSDSRTRLTARLQQRTPDDASVGMGEQKISLSEEELESVTEKVKTTDEEWEEIQRKIAAEKALELESQQDNAVKLAELSGSMVPERDKDIIDRENAPLEEGDLPLAEE